MKESPTYTHAVFLAANASFAHANPASWSLGAAARAVGWSWRIVEATESEPIQRLLLRLAHPDEPTLITASFFLFNRDFLCRILSRYKKLHPKCLVVGGGPEFLGDNRGFLEQHRYIDAIIRGEGETALAQWLKSLGQPEEQDKTPGLCRLRDDKYIDNGTAEIPALERLEIPLPEDLRNFNKPFILIETSRGCSGNCVFCSSGAGQPPARYYPIAKIRAALSRISSAGIGEIRISDRTFNESQERCLALLKMFRNDFPHIRFHLEIDPGRLTEAVMAELAKTGPNQLYLEAGIQTLKQTIATNIGRRGNPSETLDRIEQLCRMPNLRIHTDLIAGLPDATLNDLLNDLNDLIAVRPAIIQLEILKLLPGTKLADNPAQWGLLAADTPPYEILATESMPAHDMETARQLSRLVDWFYNTPDLQDTTATATAVIPEFWIKLAENCSIRTGLRDAPSLESRFKLLNDFLKQNAPDVPELRYRLLYARLRHSLTHVYEINMKAWKKPIPADAQLVEGDAGAEREQAWLAELDQPYFFVYGRGIRRAIAVYVDRIKKSS